MYIWQNRNDGSLTLDPYIELNGDESDTYIQPFLSHNFFMFAPGVSNCRTFFLQS
jgi:hypothetical protein